MFKAPETAAGVVMIFWFIAVELAYTIGASTRTSFCAVMIAVKIERLPRQTKDLQKEDARGQPATVVDAYCRHRVAGCSPAGIVRYTRPLIKHACCALDTKHSSLVLLRYADG